MIRICTSLAQAGYEVTLVGRTRSFSKPLDEKLFRQHRFRLFFKKGKFFYLEYNLRLFFYLLFKRFDAHCAIDLDTLLAGFLIHRLKRTKLVYDAHEYFTEVPELVGRPRTKIIWEKLANWIIPQLSHCYTVAPQLATILSEQYGTSFAEIRNLPLTRPTRKYKAPASNKKIILYQGMLNEGRGLEAAIMAMKKLPDALELHLVGEGDLSQQLRQLAKQEKLDHRVSFLGFITPKELQQITPQAYLGLNLLENKGLNYYYSLANKCFDYIQAGLPAIHPAFPEYTHLKEKYDAFYILEDLSPDALAKLILNIVKNEEDYHSKCQNASRAALSLNWEKESKKLLQFYAALF